MDNWLVLTMLIEYRQRDLLYEVEQWRWARECGVSFGARVRGWLVTLLVVGLVAVIIWQMG